MSKWKVFLCLLFVLAAAGAIAGGQGEAGAAEPVKITICALQDISTQVALELLHESDFYAARKYK